MCIFVSDIDNCGLCKIVGGGGWRKLLLCGEGCSFVCGFGKRGVFVYICSYTFSHMWKKGE